MNLIVEKLSVVSRQHGKGGSVKRKVNYTHVTHG